MAESKHQWEMFLQPRVLVHLVTRSARVTDLKSHKVNHRFNPDLPAYEAWKAETDRRRKIHELMTRHERELFDQYWRLKDDNVSLEEDVRWDWTQDPDFGADD